MNFKVKDIFETRWIYTDAIKKIKFNLYLENEDKLIFFTTDKKALSNMKYIIISKSEFIDLCKRGFVINDNINVELKCKESEILLLLSNKEIIKLNCISAIISSSYVRVLYYILLGNGDLCNKEICETIFNINFTKFENIVKDRITKLGLITDLAICSEVLLKCISNNSNGIYSKIANLDNCKNHKEIMHNSNFLSGYLDVQKGYYNASLPKYLSIYPLDTVVSITMIFGLIIRDRSYKEIVDMINSNKREILNEVDMIAEKHYMTKKYYKDMKLYKMKLTADWNLHVEYVLTPKLKVNKGN